MAASVILTLVCLAVVLAVLWVEHRYPEEPDAAGLDDMEWRQ